MYEQFEHFKLIIMNRTHIILKYLYKNNDGHFINIQNAFKSNSMPTDIYLISKIMELVLLNYIESRFYYENKELSSKDRDTIIVSMSLYKPQSMQVRITSTGEQYIEKNTVKIFNWIPEKRNFIIYIISALVTIITFLINSILRH